MRPPLDRQFSNLPGGIFWRDYERVDVRPRRDVTVPNVSLVNKHNGPVTIHPFAHNRDCRVGICRAPSPGASGAKATCASKLNQCPEPRLVALSYVGRG